MDVKSVICDIIKENTVIGDRIYDFDDDSNLMEHGLDSLQIMHVIVEIEQAFNFVFDDEDLLVVNFNNISSIERCVKSILSNRTK